MDMKINKIRIIRFFLTIIISSLISSLMVVLIQFILNKNINYYNENILKVVEVAADDEIENKSYGSACP